MSDDSDDYDLNNICYEINQYEFGINKIRILKKNKFYDENVDEKELNQIDYLYTSCKINNPDLLNKIQICAEKKILDYSIIEQIIICAIGSSLATEIEKNLNEFYEFLLELEFKVNDTKIIREIVKKNLKLVNNDNNNFQEIIKAIKEEILIIKLNIKEDYIKNLIYSCIEKNWPLKRIETFLSFLKPLYIQSVEGLKDKELEKVVKQNELKIQTAESLLNTITSFPNKNFIEILKYIKFDNLSDIARDFYLKCASGKNNEKKELSTQELLNSIQKLNKNYFSKEKINMFNEQIEICKKIMFKKPNTSFKKWIENELNQIFIQNTKPYYFKDKKEKNRNIAKILGMISLGMKKSTKHFLRDVQILALLILIDNYESQEEITKEDQRGIIEEIATGEGKSTIIGCLAAYFGLKKNKVDIITSSSVLAQRDASEFSYFYKTMNLKVSYCKDNGKEREDDNIRKVYREDIIYGTFLSFEGDLLEEITNNKEIRGKRDFDIIIIDEVDNAFIDCIEGSTQLSQASKGYQFLLPLYISIYFFVDILDNLYLEEVRKQYNEIISREDYKNLDEISKKKIEDKLSDDSDRKDIFINYIEKYIKDALKDINKEKNNISDNKIQSIQEIDDDAKLKNFLLFPDFLKDFVEANLVFWINSAFSAKNEMILEKDYTLSSKINSYKTITPIDRKNTGELEFNTHYKRGLHQMLQIKEKVRVFPETLDHTFMSHITYFSNYTNKRKFFGLTGTIGGKETHKIYKSKYFNSNLIFIPSYIAKKFIELPPIICEENYKNHLMEICKEIIFHYSKGRKILVICKDIKEGNNIKKLLEEDQKDKIINNDYKKEIFSYLRNDDEELQNELKKTTNRIIISTNLGGRGTDIKTIEPEEESGGLHVIITKLSENSRTQKQAFGRTSRQGKKGTGQYILTEKKGLKTYNQLIKERDEKEKNSIENINLDYLLLKDNLFREYVNFTKDIEDNEGKYIKSDIDEKWSLFLTKNVKDDKDPKTILADFKIFQNEIKANLELKNNYKKFKNNFLRILNGVNDHENFDVELRNYFNFKDNSQCFYFASSYYNAIISFKLHEKNFKKDINNKSFCEEIVRNLKETKQKLVKLIEINIEPILKSFDDWKKISKIDELLQISDARFNESDGSFISQFRNRKILLKELIEIVEDNIKVVQDYIDKYLPTNIKGLEAELIVEKKDIKESFELGKEYQNDISDYLSDAGLLYTFKFIIKKKIFRRNIKYFFFYIGFYIFFSILSMMKPLISKGTSSSIFNSIKELLSKYLDIDNVIEQNSMFSVINSKISANIPEEEKKENNKYFLNNKHKESKQVNLRTKEELNIFKEEILEKIKNCIIDNLKEKKGIIMEQIKFLLLIDLYYRQTTWSKTIKNLISDYFNENQIILKKKVDLIRMCSFISEKEVALENLKNIVKEAIVHIINKIKEKFESNEFKKDEIKRLEHIIITDCKGNEKIASDIMTQILSQGIIYNNGMFNSNLFKKQQNNIKENDKIDKYGNRNRDSKKKKNDKDKDGKIAYKEKKQNVKIYYNIPYPDKINKIESIKKFSLPLNLSVSIENDELLHDVQLLYLYRGYQNPDKLLVNDFSKKIIYLLNKLYFLSMKDFDKLAKKLLGEMGKKIKDIIETYLNEEIYPNIKIKTNKNKDSELNEEEQKIFTLIRENSGKKALDLLKSKEFFKLK